MNWENQPATWKQLKLLRQLGHKTDHVLTKTAAAELIVSLGGPPENQETPAEQNIRQLSERGAAYHLRVKVEDAREAFTKAGRDQFSDCEFALAKAIAERQEFWVDTCSDAPKTHVGLVQAHEFYQKFGCRFTTPTPKDAQHILDALDSALPVWDRDHPELFYQTLEINFPQLLRRR